uniref:Uncharacterized protein n=1 Tax=Glossina palpalis gambiensis TaxID=67801 RepID=A0A1B0C511_9MUSC
MGFKIGRLSKLFIATIEWTNVGSVPGMYPDMSSKMIKYIIATLETCVCEVRKASSVDITIVGTSGELPMASAVASLLPVVIKDKFLDVAKLPDSVGLRILDKEAPVGTTVAPEVVDESCITVTFIENT